MGAIVAVVVLVVTNLFLFVWPPVDSPTHADVILSLNGRDEAAREARALSLAEKGYAPILLFSKGTYVTNCPVGVTEVRVVCFVPVPGTTAGEMEYAARYMKAHRLHSMLVVAGRSQTLRARLLLDRCFSGKVSVVGVSVPWWDTGYEMVYEWGAMAKALVLNRSC